MSAITSTRHALEGFRRVGRGPTRPIPPRAGPRPHRRRVAQPSSSPPASARAAPMRPRAPEDAPSDAAWSSRRPLLGRNRFSATASDVVVTVRRWTVRTRPGGRSGRAVSGRWLRGRRSAACMPRCSSEPGGSGRRSSASTRSTVRRHATPYVGSVMMSATTATARGSIAPTSVSVFTAVANAMPAAYHGAAPSLRASLQTSTVFQSLCRFARTQADSRIRRPLPPDLPPWGSATTAT